MISEERIRDIPVLVPSDYRKRRLARAYAFFREHGERAEYSYMLAKAELAAESLGWECRWEEDDEASSEEGRELLWCALYDADGRVLESLGAIELTPLFGFRDPYARVVEADLCLEAVERHASEGAAELASRATYAAGES